MKNLAILALAGLLAGCANQTQTAAVTAAAIDAGSCVLTVAPAITTVAQGSGSNADKAIAAGGVAVQAAVSVAPCRDAPAAIAAAVAAGNAVSVQPVAAPAK